MSCNVGTERPLSYGTNYPARKSAVTSHGRKTCGTHRERLLLVPSEIPGAKDPQGLGTRQKNLAGMPEEKRDGFDIT